jgi:hypothetical protein
MRLSAGGWGSGTWRAATRRATAPNDDHQDGAERVRKLYNTAEQQYNRCGTLPAVKVRKMLSQAEANRLLDLPKYLEFPTSVSVPQCGRQREASAVSENGRERFTFDIYRGSVSVSKCSYQNRYRKEVRLLRLDLGGSTHLNPDNTHIICPHLHIYKEGYSDRWAYPLPASFSGDQSLVVKLIEFLRYCKVANIDEVPYQEMTGI